MKGLVDHAVTFSGKQPIICSMQSVKQELHIFVRILLLVARKLGKSGILPACQVL
jgi:hypothetical protein